MLGPLPADRAGPMRGVDHRRRRQGWTTTSSSQRRVRSSSRRRLSGFPSGFRPAAAEIRELTGASVTHIVAPRPQPAVAGTPPPPNREYA